MQKNSIIDISRRDPLVGGFLDIQKCLFAKQIFKWHFFLGITIKEGFNPHGIIKNKSQ